jgi:hypothetical protein
MAVFDFSPGLASVVLAILTGIALFYPLAMGGGLLLARSLQATGRFVPGLWRNLLEVRRNEALCCASSSKTQLASPVA